MGGEHGKNCKLEPSAATAALPLPGCRREAGEAPINRKQTESTGKAGPSSFSSLAVSIQLTPSWQSLRGAAGYRVPAQNHQAEPFQLSN